MNVARCATPSTGSRMPSIPHRSCFTSASIGNGRFFKSGCCERHAWCTNSLSVLPPSTCVSRSANSRFSLPNAAISVGERGHTKWDFVPILENKLADYIMPDVTWTGGITELKKISALCEAYYIPVSPHDAAGPINVVAGAHVMMTVPNFYKLETSEWNLNKYNPLIDVPLDNSNGSLKLPNKPGLGYGMNREYLEANAIEV